MPRTYYEITIITRTESIPFGSCARLTYSSYELARQSADIFADKFNVYPKISKIVAEVTELPEEVK